MKIVFCAVIMSVILLTGIARSDEVQWISLPIEMKIGYIKGYADSCIIMCIAGRTAEDEKDTADFCLKSNGIQSAELMQKTIQFTDSIYSQKKYRIIPLRIGMSIIHSTVTGKISAIECMEYFDAFSRK